MRLGAIGGVTLGRGSSNSLSKAAREKERERATLSGERELWESAG